MAGLEQIALGLAADLFRFFHDAGPAYPENVEVNTGIDAGIMKSIILTDEDHQGHIGLRVMDEDGKVVYIGMY